MKSSTAPNKAYYEKQGNLRYNTTQTNPSKYRNQPPQQNYRPNLNYYTQPRTNSQQKYSQEKIPNPYSSEPKRMSMTMSTGRACKYFKTNECIYGQ